jgi:hypothetical protein
MAQQSPFGPDWIVFKVSTNTRGGLLVEGNNLNYTEDDKDRAFRWNVQPKNLLWDRYDLTSAVWEPEARRLFEHARRTQSLND